MAGGDGADVGLGGPDHQGAQQTHQPLTPDGPPRVERLLYGLLHPKNTVPRLHASTVATSGGRAPSVLVGSEFVHRMHCSTRGGATATL